MYVAYREVFIAHSKHIKKPKLQRTVNQNKINTCQKQAWNENTKALKIQKNVRKISSIPTKCGLSYIYVQSIYQIIGMPVKNRTILSSYIQSLILEIAT